MPLNAFRNTQSPFQSALNQFQAFGQQQQAMRRQDEQLAQQQAQQQAAIDLAQQNRAEDIARADAAAKVQQQQFQARLDAKKAAADKAIETANAKKNAQVQANLAALNAQDPDNTRSKELKMTLASTGHSTFPSQGNKLSAVERVDIRGRIRDLRKQLPTAQQIAKAKGAAASSDKALSIVDDLIKKSTEDSTTTGIKGAIRGTLEPVAAFFGKEDALPPKVTRSKDQATVLLALTRKALAGVGAASDRDMKIAESIISSIDWTGQPETISAKLNDLRDLINSSNIANTTLLEGNDSTKRDLRDLRLALNPPAKDARKAPDGNWYVERPKGSGKYFQVEVK